MEFALKESIIQELLKNVALPASITPEAIIPIVKKALEQLKAAGIGATAFEDGKIPAIGDIIGIAGKVSVEVQKLDTLKGAEKLQVVLGVVEVLLSYLEGVKPAWGVELKRLKAVAHDVLPASLSFAVSVAKGELDFGSLLRKPEGVSHVEHGRSLFRRFVGLLRRLTPALALCGASSAAAAIVDQIEEAPRSLVQKAKVSFDLPPVVLEKAVEVVGIGPLDIPSEKEPVAPLSTPRPSSEEPLAKEEVPPSALEVKAEEVRNAVVVQSSVAVSEPENDAENDAETSTATTDPARNSPLTDGRRILHDA